LIRGILVPLDDDVTGPVDQLDGLRFAVLARRRFQRSRVAAFRKVVVFLQLSEAEFCFLFEV
jgi:hypothetical protein